MHHIGLFILSNTWGGAESSIAEIATHLDKHQFRIFILANEFLCDHYQNIDGVQVINLGRLESNKKLTKIQTILQIQTNLRQAIQQHQLHVVHGRLENAILTLGFCLRKIHPALFFTLSGDEARIYHSPQTFEQRLIRRYLRNMLYTPTMTVTAVSNWLVKEFNNAERSRISITPNGIDTTIFKPIPNIISQPKTIMYVGRLVQGKGIEDLLEIAKELTDYEFWFVGQGPLDELINLPNTKHFGFKSRAELIELYAQTTICAFPSYAEGMPMVGLEAMACGNAIITSKAGFSEYIEHEKDGLLVDAGDLLQIKSMITHLLENPNVREEIATNARIKARKYDIRQTVRNYENLYLKAINK